MRLPRFDALLSRLTDRFNNARFFTVSLLVHVVVVAVFGTMVLVKSLPEVPDFSGEYAPEPSVASVRVPTPSSANPGVPALNPLPSAVPGTTLPQIMVPGVGPLVLPVAPGPSESIGMPGQGPPIENVGSSVVAGVGEMTDGDRERIREFAQWTQGAASSSRVGRGGPVEFDFVAFVGQYAGGNWDSTVDVRGGEIVGGSLPNLLYVISKWSKDRIKTNERNVRAIRLDSDELFSERPPFVFLTGSRDFKLTDKEVENLRKYVRSGGAIWGDSSVPGRRSRFDIAFRREMKRVVPDVDKQFEPLPRDHPIFTRGYYREIAEVPAGLNYYREPVYALKVFGEIAIIYTANDYGDMFRVGLTEDGQIDTGRDERGAYVANDSGLWDHRNTYVHNLTPTSLESAYRFGTNVVVHLLTRWDDKVHGVPGL